MQFHITNNLCPLLEVEYLNTNIFAKLWFQLRLTSHTSDVEKINKISSEILISFSGKLIVS